MPCTGKAPEGKNASDVQNSQSQRKEREKKAGYAVLFLFFLVVVDTIQNTVLWTAKKMRQTPYIRNAAIPVVPSILEHIPARTETSFICLRLLMYYLFVARKRGFTRNFAPIFVLSSGYSK